MSNTGREDIAVTIVVVPRERFSVSQASLESIYANTQMPFKLVYIDGGSPGYIKDYLESEAVKKDFHLQRTEHFLSPNQARNLGVQHAQGRFVVFIDNDVLVSPGWLEALTGCAGETGASVVAPLYFIGDPEKEIIHMAGGDLQVEEKDNGLYMSEQHRFANRPLSEVKDRIRRGRCGFAEFHCMLVRKQVLDDLGPLDEKLLSVHEHIDLCHAVELAGGSTWLEPDARVTYRADLPFRLSDIPYFKLRWSDDWNECSFNHIAGKWKLTAESPIFNENFRGWVKKHGQQLELPGDGRRPALAADAVPGTAQTNIQLYHQCMDLEYEDWELTVVRDAYRRAQVWFDGLYRGCGRPFLAHLVGTASILARHGASASLVAAGMLHSVYEFGDLDIPDEGITERKRRYVASRTTPEIEHLLYHYANMAWYGTDTTAMEGNLDHMPLLIARVLLLRMANDLEERHDRSLAFCSKDDSTIEPWLALFQAVAQRLGANTLYEELEEACLQNQNFGVPDLLHGRQTGSYVIHDGKKTPATAAALRRDARRLPDSEAAVGRKIL